MCSMNDKRYYLTPAVTSTPKSNIELRLGASRESKAVKQMVLKHRPVDEMRELPIAPYIEAEDSSLTSALIPPLWCNEQVVACN